MSKSKLTQRKTSIELTARGVFQIRTARAGETERKKIARLIRLRAVGRRESDGVTFAQIRFRTMHGDYRSELFTWSKLLPKNRDEIKNKLAELGYEWPENEALTGEILKQVANTTPERQFRVVSAPGWYGSVLVRPGQVFARGTNKPEIYIDPKNDAHLGAFILGEGSLKGWHELVAKPSRQSSCLRLSIAAALGALFLRPLGLDSFGINWFSDTSDGKSHALFVAASVAGLMGPDGLPSWADSESAIEALARGHRDCVMPLDEAADDEAKTPIEKKARLLAFLIARNRARRLSPIYERSHNLANREFRIIVLSSSERALGQIARAANARRLGGEEVRFMDIPASDPNSPGIFDGNIEPAPDKTLRETTKELVETLKVNAIKHQGYAYRELQERYVNDPHGLRRLKTYKEQFERDAVLPEAHNAYYRVRTNFAVMYAAAAFKRWVQTHSERAALKEKKVILTEREDTATVERKIGGIKGKPRYYAVDIRALRRLASE